MRTATVVVMFRLGGLRCHNTTILSGLWPLGCCDAASWCSTIRTDADKRTKSLLAQEFIDHPGGLWSVRPSIYLRRGVIDMSHEIS